MDNYSRLIIQFGMSFDDVLIQKNEKGDQRNNAFFCAWNKTLETIDAIGQWIT